MEKLQDLKKEKTLTPVIKPKFKLAPMKGYYFNVCIK